MSATAAAPELTPALRRRGLFAAIGCTVSAVTGLCISLPLLSVIMERDMGVSGAAIGFSTTVSFASALIFIPFMPRLMARFPQGSIMALCALTSACSMVLYGMFPDYYFWLAVRVANGAALAGLFTIGEIWINQFAEDSYRGRIIGLYAVALGVGIAVGPLFLQLTGTETSLPFILSGAVIFLASAPLLAARGMPQFFHTTERPQFLVWFMRAPVIILPALMCGAVEVAADGLLPVYALRTGYPANNAVLMLSIFAGGTILSAVVVGWLADLMDRLRLMLLLSLFWLALFIAAPFAQSGFSVLALITIGLGFCSTGTYMIGMVLGGQRYSGAELAAVGAALIFAYHLGGLAAPVMAGWLMDNALPNENPDGLLYFLCLLVVPIILATIGERKKT